jgi:hypothetical protein
MNSQTTFGKAIIGKALTFSLALGLAGSAALFTTTAYAADSSSNADATQDNSSSYSADDLDNLLAPIALYPDSLLAQVLIAATFDDQIQEASQALSAGAAVDDQPWDDSVKAVAHYPKVLFTLAAQPDWTSALGQAYVAQSTDVMNSIQRLRSMALAQGNLVSSQQQRVSSVAGVIQILSPRAGYMSLPYYDPSLAFSTPVSVSFGPAKAIDNSCDNQIDWHEHHIFDRHHHLAKTGDHSSRGSIRNVRGRLNTGAQRGQVARGPANPGRLNSGFARGPVSRGLSNAGYTHGTVNRGQSNTGSTHAPANRGQSNAGSTHAPVNRAQSNANANRAQVSRASFTTAINRGFAGARSSGRTARR